MAQAGSKPEPCHGRSFRQPARRMLLRISRRKVESRIQRLTNDDRPSPDAPPRRGAIEMLAGFFRARPTPCENPAVLIDNKLVKR